MLLLIVPMMQGCSQERKPGGMTHLVLLELTSSDCAACSDIHQILQDLKPRYKDEITFATLDLSGISHKLQARETARNFNSSAFVHRYQDYPGTVAILSALNGEKVEMLQNNRDKKRYIKMIEDALAQAPKK